MRFERILVLVLLIAVVHAGLFGEDPEVAKRRKRQEAAKTKKREGKDTKKQKPKKPKAKGWFGGEAEEEDPAKPIQTLEIQEILTDPDNIDTVTMQDNPNLKQEEIYGLWEKNMHDFVPEDLVNFVVDSSSATVLYEDIGHTSPTTIKGAYYVHGGQDARVINVFVQDPNKNIIYKRSDEIQGIMIFDTTIPGQYAFIFSNLDDSTIKTVTMAIHTFEDKDELIQYEISPEGERTIVFDPKSGKPQSEDQLDLDLAGDAEIGNVRNSLRSIQTSTKQIQTETIMSFHRQHGLNHDTIMNQHWYLYAMAVELMCFMAVLGGQMYYLKHKLDNKLIM